MALVTPPSLRVGRVCVRRMVRLMKTHQPEGVWPAVRYMGVR